MNEIINSVASTYNWKDFYKPIIKQTVAVPETILEEYVGDYQGNLGKNIVTREGNQLFYRWTNGKTMKTFPETETRFFFKELEARLDFIRDASGKVVKRIMIVNGQTTEAKKIK